MGKEIRSGKKIKKVWVLLGILLTGWAFDPYCVFAARPLITEDAETVGKGAIELELGFDYFRHDNGDKDYIPLAQLKYGPMDRLEIGAGIGYIHRELHLAGTVRGWGDLTAYLKYRAWDERDDYPAFALKGLVKFSTADGHNDLGSRKTDYAFGPILSKSFSGLKLHFDALYFVIGGKDETDVLAAGLATEYEFIKGWTAVGEVRYTNNFNADRGDDPLFVNLGLKKDVGRAVFDLAVNFGLNSAAPDYGFTVGVTLKLK